MRLFYICFFNWMVSIQWLFGQTISSSLPKLLNPTNRYLFYLHGKIIEDQGLHAVHPQFGKYEYLAILDTLARHGFIVISEVRHRNTNELGYAGKVSAQIDTLILAGVPPKNIFVLGASKGAYIAILVAIKKQNRDLNYIIMGTCSDETTMEFQSNSDKLCGRFLSIFDSSDLFASSCKGLFENKPCVTNFSEITINLGNGHGFLYKPYPEWVQPLLRWANK